MKKEIEIKIQFGDHDTALFVDWLDSNAKFLSKEHHMEWYLENPSNPFSFINNEGIRDAFEYLRVRTNNGKSTMCLKRWHGNAMTKATVEAGAYCEEYEFAISDEKDAIALMKSIGYSDVTEIEKSRTKYIFGDYEIVMDEVKGVGNFVEIEVILEKDDITEARQDIFNLLKEIGFRSIRIFKRGYVSFVWNPLFDFSEEVQL